MANPEGAAEPHPFTTYDFFAALEESGLPGHRLELEITESVLIDDEDKVLSYALESAVIGRQLSKSAIALLIFALLMGLWQCGNALTGRELRGSAGAV